MSYKELAEIVDMINEIEILNPRPGKLEPSTISPKALKYPNDRKQSLPPSYSSLITFQKSNSHNESLFGTARKSLFQFERSYSSSNLFQPNLESQSLFPESEGACDTFDCNSKRMHFDKFQVYESVSSPIRNEYVNSESLGLTSNYLDMKAMDMFEAINIRPQIPMKPKNSLDLIKTMKLKHSIISEKDYIESVQFNSEYNQKLQSAPESTRNSECIKDSNPKLENYSSDSGNSSGLLTNKLGSNLLTFSISNDQGTSSESSFDISDSYPTAGTTNEIFIIETDSPTVTEKPNEKSLSPKSTRSAEIKSVQSEEDKIKFLQKVSKEISSKTYSIKEIIRFYIPNGAYSSQIVDKSQTAFSVCSILKIHFNINPRAQWQLTEVIHNEKLERPLEDHENITEVYYSWQSENTCNRFLFQENPQMYKIFLNPCAFKSEMKCDFEIDSIIWVKESNSKWRKVSCFILDSTIYFKIKPDSKDHKDLYSLVNLKNYDFYSCTDNYKMKKYFRAPTSNLIVFKNKEEHKSQGYACLCTLNSEQKEKWVEALKVAKYSFKQLQENYLNNEKYLEIKTSKQNYSTDFFGLISI